MKVLFLTEGGQNIGFGHVARCVALSQALEEKNVENEFLIDADNSILEIIRGNKFSLYNWREDTKRLFKAIDCSDFIVVDSYMADKWLYDEISETKGGRILIIDDNMRINYPEGIVVNPSIYGDMLNYPKNRGITYLLGKDYIVLRKEFWNVPEKKIKSKIENVLITLGGMDNYGFIKEIETLVNKEFGQSVNIINTKKRDLKAREILDLMLEADICISGGGQTLNELARLGVPSIGICLADNQKKNLEGWERVGFLKRAGWISDNDLWNKLEGIIKKLDYKLRKKMHEIGKQCVDSKGPERISWEILKKRVK